MSVRTCNLVWKLFQVQGGHLKLAMLALADYADDKGGRIFPSVVTLAGKIACSESAARRAVHKLIQLRAVRVVANRNGGMPGMPRHYELDIEGLRAGLYLKPEGARRVASALGVKRPGRVASTTPLASAPPLAPTRETGSVHDTLTVINHQLLPGRTTRGEEVDADDADQAERANSFARQYGGATWH
jgi:hypothetical protein